MNKYELQEQREQAERVERRTQAAQARASRKGNIWRGGLAVLAGATLTLGLIERNRGNPPSPTKAPIASKAVLSKEASDLEHSPKFSGLQCFVQKRTVEPNQTIFGLSTAGLRADQPFMDKVYRLNLRYARQQAKTNKDLSVFDKMPIGTKLKIWADCIEYTPVQTYFSDNPKIKPRFNSTGQQIPNAYVRTITYQDYLGTDGKRHNDVGIDYFVKPDGQPTSVSDCWPAPGCYSYVAGAPNPPSDN